MTTIETLTHRPRPPVHVLGRSTHSPGPPHRQQPLAGPLRGRSAPLRGRRLKVTELRCPTSTIGVRRTFLYHWLSEPVIGDQENTLFLLHEPHGARNLPSGLPGKLTEDTVTKAVRDALEGVSEIKLTVTGPLG